MTRSRWWLARMTVAVIGLPAAAAAHLEFFPGRLLDLVQRSDSVVVATVDVALPQQSDGRNAWRVRLAVADGEPEVASLATAPGLALEPGATYAFFVRHEESVLGCIHPPGVVFPAGEAPDAVPNLARELRPLLDGPPERVHQVLIPALRTPQRELRYQVALALHDAAHGQHRLSREAQEQLRAVLDADDGDPALRVLLRPLLSEPAAAATPAPLP